MEWKFRFHITDEGSSIILAETSVEKYQVIGKPYSDITGNIS